MVCELRPAATIREPWMATALAVWSKPATTTALPPVPKELFGVPSGQNLATMKFFAPPRSCT